jgi:hypothetical protein
VCCIFNSAGLSLYFLDNSYLNQINNLKMQTCLFLVASKLRFSNEQENQYPLKQTFTFYVNAFIHVQTLVNLQMLIIVIRNYNADLTAHRHI